MMNSNYWIEADLDGNKVCANLVKTKFKDSKKEQVLREGKGGMKKNKSEPKYGKLTALNSIYIEEKSSTARAITTATGPTSTNHSTATASAGTGFGTFSVDSERESSNA